MNNENYYNYYIETLTATMTDAVIRNISLQTNIKINQDNISELNNTIELLDAEIGRLKEESENQAITVQSEISRLNGEISRLNGESHQVNTMKSECENIKGQLQHLETFRNELARAREEKNNIKDDYELRIQKLEKEHSLKIDELNEQIEYLKLTPAKRKKLDEERLKPNNDEVEDGGTF